MSRLILAAALVINSVSVLAAQPVTGPADTGLPPQTEATPSTMPATAPAVVVVAVDQSTPRGALKVMTQALEDGDANRAKGVLLIEGAEQTMWAEAMLSLASAGALVKKASVEKFGDEGAKAVVGDTAMATAMAMSAIDRSTEELDGERETVRAGDSGEMPVELKRVNGEWRLPMKAIIGDAEPAMLKETADRMNRQVTAMRAFSTDVAADKYASPAEAAQALQLQMVQAVFGEAAAPPAASATRPATMPGGPG